MTAGRHFARAAPPSGDSTPAILVVDDRPENLLAMKKLLRGLAAEIVLAASGPEGLEIALGRSDIALILLDVQMPDMDGFETAEILRFNQSTKDIPIVFVTAAGDDAQRLFKGYDSGAVDFLPKPIPEKVLLSKVQVFLDLGHQRGELLRNQSALEATVAELESCQRELERSNAALKDFAYGAAHDLQAPLRHIRFWIGSALKKQESGGDSVTQILEEVDRSSERMQRLVTGLLDYALVGSDEPDFVDLDLSDVLRNVLDDLDEAIAESGATVTTSDLPTVRGESMQLRRLFQNLVGNALKYRREGVLPDIQIRAVGDPVSEMCQIEVTDKGIGFESEQEKLIFQPFRRLVSHSRYSGSGIGMATAKNIVAVHGGELWATAVAGQGATFSLTLQRSAVEPCLLIVDDDVVELAMTKRGLRRSNMEIVFAKSARQALDEINKRRFIAILTDLNLPGEDGVWLLTRLAESHPHVLRILTSSIDMADLEQHTNSGVVQHFVLKMVSSVQLERMLEGQRAA
ncbi:MAG: response regulator [Deltaproteobacteria bacterium]|nr:response regulator [Deltaproteobacteria bacterium]